MSQEKRVVIFGGHGKVALLATGKLKAEGYAVDNVIRNPDQADEIRGIGGNPVVLDIEDADVSALASAMSGAAAVVFAAGAGGGNPARTKAVDYEAAVRTMDAAEREGISRYVIVSYDSADSDVDRLDPEDDFYPYAKAKHDADAHLRDTSLGYTILAPGRLTMDASDGRITRVGAPKTGDERVTARDTVAEVIAHAIANEAALRETVIFYEGETPIAESV